MKNLIHDSGMIDVKSESSTLVFFIAMFVAFAALTLVWVGNFEVFIRNKTPFYLTTNEYNIFSIVKNIYTPNPDMAIVGSSFSMRLNPGLFTSANVMNLSVDGGSVVTGLEVLTKVKNPPKILLIEINILDRLTDQELKVGGQLAACSSVGAVLSGFTKPFRYILGKPYFSYDPEAQLRAWRLDYRVSVRAKAPATYDNDVLIASGKLKWDARNYWDRAAKNINRIKELTTYLEARGISVYYMYLPYQEGYDNHSYAQRNREIASENALFTCDRCLDIRNLVDMNEIRWNDGAHLDERSAMIVAEALERYFKI